MAQTNQTGEAKHSQSSSGLTAREALEMVTPEDLAIFFHNLGETARLATRAECVEFGELTADARVMKRCMRLSNGRQWEPVIRACFGLDRAAEDAVRNARNADRSFRMFAAGVRS